jgi:hypothetical protein
MKLVTVLGLSVATLVPLALGAAGCVCTVQGTGSASGTASANPTTTATPTPAPAPLPATTATATATAAAPHSISLHGGVTVPVIKGSGTFGDDQEHPDALRGVVYFLPENTSKLPDFATLKPFGVLYTRQLNIAPRRFDQGFPGIDNRFEWFGIRYDGHFTVAKDGDYQWHVVSDDGSIITVDGNVVINNDGVHPPTSKTATATLKAGTHTIRVDYFQGPRYDIALQLWVTPPGGKEQLWSPSF